MVIEHIEWTQRFAQQTKEIILFLRENTSASSVDKFKQELEAKILYIAKHPTAHRKVKNRKAIRFSNFMKNYQLFYRVKGNSLIISAIFDTRQAPDKRPY